MMVLNNGSTDGESDSHAIILGGVERFEESARSLRVEPGSRILHCQTNVVVFLSFGFDQQLPRTIFDGGHRVRRIPDEIQYDLLQLDSIARDEREVFGKFRSQNHPVSLKIAQG